MLIYSKPKIIEGGRTNGYYYYQTQHFNTVLYHFNFTELKKYLKANGIKLPPKKKLKVIKETDTNIYFEVNE